MKPLDAALMGLMRQIADGDAAAVKKALAGSPLMAGASIEEGATRRSARPWFLADVQHYVYGGDTALHVAAATYRHAIARVLLTAGADVRARNRRGQEPLHYAADGVPGARGWDPKAQAATIARLIAAGADPNAGDSTGVTPLHRAVRTRCAAAVEALLAGGADPRRKTDKGSTAARLAQVATGRGGSGSAEAKAQQEQIVKLLGGKRRRRS
ncbi:MAG TPA: ankyrin repeat domain-containing protein [Polyangia bacterium]|nr:ankyrin repeat domain-containing protein [Polyangia bacterium]